MNLNDHTFANATEHLTLTAHNMVLEPLKTFFHDGLNALFFPFIALILPALFLFSFTGLLPFLLWQHCFII